LARAIAAVRKIPLYGLNHLEGHALTARLTHQVTFPYLLLLVSGGHSQFLLIENVGQYTRLGTTIDDAVGEAFDKVAKLLGFPYPGGPYVERAAQGGDGGRYKLPVPMLGRTGCDLSLSGLKTAVRHLVMEQPKPLGEKTIADIAASFQQAVGTMLANRAENAMEEFIRLYPKTSRALAVAGGVSANKYIAQKLEQAAAKYNFQIIVPPLNLCTDNAVMMAWAAIERHQAGIQNNPDFTARPRWPLDSRAAEMLSAAKA
jgi:N6-L-threonylcarbamoyladenine synthase